jgi:hypothetical protein
MSLTANVRITTPFGYPLDIPLSISSLRAVRSINGIGYFELGIPGSAFPKGLFELDRRIEIELQPVGREPVLAFVGLMRMRKSIFNAGYFIEDYRDEVNYVYVGGKGQDTARIVRERSEDERIRRSPINRREAFAQYSNEDDLNILDAHGDKKLNEQLPQIELTRDLGNLSGRVFGADWQLGDLITVASDAPDEVIIAGPGWEDILATRIVAYKKTTSEAQKSGLADSVILEYVDEQLVNATDSDRNLPTAMGFTLGADPAAAPSIEHSANFGNLVSTIKAITEKAAKGGTVIRWGFEPVRDGKRYVPRFDVRIGKWGQQLNWVLGSGPENDQAEIAAIDIEVGRDGLATVRAKTRTTWTS